MARSDRRGGQAPRLRGIVVHWPDWMNRGLCTIAGIHPETFFPPKTDGRNAGRDARKICADCPVRQTCLEYAIEFPTHLDGIWGGTSEIERRAMRRARRRTA